MNFSNIIDKAALIIKIIVKNNKPIDILFSNFMRDNKYIGSKERKFLSESVFSTIRIWLLCNHIFQLSKNIYDFNLDSKIETRRFPISEIHIKYIISLIIFEMRLFSSNNYIPSNLLNNIVTKQDNKFSVLISNYFIENNILDNFNFYEFTDFILNIFQQLIKSEELSDLSILTSTPEWIVNNLSNYYDFNNLKSIFYQCLQPANVCLRVNSMQTNSSNLINYLNINNVASFKGNFSPDCIILESRAKIDTLDLFKNGGFEFQDEGSQLISYALAPNSNWKILDACAGAGGKSLHIALLQNDYGDITSLDIQYLKLKELRFRANKCNLKSIKTKLVNIKTNLDTFFHNQKFDAILVDAPCSGMGTIRRDPTRKYQLTPKSLKNYSDNQYRILTNYSKHLKNGGVLVYATCSFMPEENELVIKRFLEHNSEFSTDSLKKVFELNNIHLPDLKDDDYFITLRPDVHSTDGFFIARLIKQGI